jgi:hypothetical protein
VGLVTCNGPSGRSTLTWGATLWWTTTRRRWRQVTGSLLLGAGLAVFLIMGTFTRQAGGEPLYLTLLLLLCAGVIVAAPLLLRGPSPFSSTRIRLLPVAPLPLWMLRIAFANPLRSFLALVVLGWATLLPARLQLQPVTSLLLLLQVAAVITVAGAASQLLEDAIEQGRAVVLHQLAFLGALASWPLVLDYLRVTENFNPAPSWTVGPAGSLLLGAGGWWPLRLGSALALLAAGAALFKLDRWVLARYSARPSPPPASVRWTGWMSRRLTAPFGGNWMLRRALLVPLRFLFLRMTMVFLALTTAASFLWGMPYLLLALPFWWQPLSTNALGPDVGSGDRRLHLMGSGATTTLRYRTPASLLLTTLVAATVALGFGLAGSIRVPVVGPESRAAYLIVFLYALTLTALMDTAGDRYSTRYPDHLAMGTLLPERSRSAGAAAITLLFVMWSVVVLLAAAVAMAGFGLAHLLSAPTSPTTTLSIVLLVGGAGNLVLYFLHRRMYLRGVA